MTEILSGILGLLIGGLLGHWLAMNRDRRREFNQVAAPAVQHLLDLEEQLRTGLLWTQVDEDLICKVRPYLSERKRNRLETLLANYRSALDSAHPVRVESPWQGPERLTDRYPNVLHQVVKLRKFLKVL